MAQIVGPSPYTRLGRTWEVAPNDSSDISPVIRRPSSASVATMPPMLTERWRRDPPWVRVSLVVLLAGTAVLYLWGLGASGWANSYYSAAVQAGASSWKAFFFGSSDAGGGAHVPVQQSRRAPHVASHRSRVRNCAGAGRGTNPLACAGVRARGIRVPGQDAPGVPHRAGARARLPGGRAHSVAPATR